MNRQELKVWKALLREKTYVGGDDSFKFKTTRQVETEEKNRGIDNYLMGKLLPTLDALPHGARVLELGIGKGVAFAELRKRYPHLKFYGTNYYPKGKNPSTEPHVAFAEGSNLPYRDAGFDFIYSVAMFPYVPDKLKHLEEVHRVLKKGGKALLYHESRFGAYPKGKQLVDVRLQDKPEIKIHGTEKGVIEITKQKPRLRFGMKLNLKQCSTAHFFESIYHPKPQKRSALRRQQRNE
ncbi:MAG: class I SAM-dependent methyltransferase [Candidatus Micrarchaeota archaeon]